MPTTIRMIAASETRPPSHQPTNGTTEMMPAATQMLRRTACSIVGLLVLSGPKTFSFMTILPTVSPRLDSM